MRNLLWSVAMGALTLFGLLFFMFTLRIFPYMIGFYIFMGVSIKAVREIIQENRELREKGLRK